MFFAIEPQTSRVYSAACARPSCRPSSSRDRNIALRDEQAARRAAAPPHSQFGLFHGQRFPSRFATDKPIPSRFIAVARISSVSGRPTYVFQQAHPSACFTTSWYSCCTGGTCATASTLGVTLDLDLRLPRQARHMRKTCPPSARAPAHEALIRIRDDCLQADVAPLARRVLRARRDCCLNSAIVSLLGLLGPQQFRQFRYRSGDELGHGHTTAQEMGCVRRLPQLLNPPQARREALSG